MAELDKADYSNQSNRSLDKSMITEVDESFESNSFSDTSGEHSDKKQSFVSSDSDNWFKQHSLVSDPDTKR